MVIIFYGENDKIYICEEGEVMKVVDKDDPNLLDHIPSRDIYYVQDAHRVTKHQFSEWLQGGFDMEEDYPVVNKTSRFTGFMDEPAPRTSPTADQSNPQKPRSKGKRLFIHPTANGFIRLEDVRTKEFPNGVELHGKWHFIPVDTIGEDNLFESNNFKIALNKGKIEVVDEQYVEQNKHKAARKVSPAQASLDAILIPADMKAEAAAANGGIGKTKSKGSDVIELYIDG